MPQLDCSICEVQEIELDMSIIWSLQECYTYQKYLDQHSLAAVMRFIDDVVPNLTVIVLRLDVDLNELLIDAVRWAFGKRDIQISYRYILGVVQHEDGVARELLSKKYRLHV